MLPDEVKTYTESYQYIWAHRQDYQEFRFNVMNMWVPDNVDDPAKMLSNGCMYCGRPVIDAKSKDWRQNLICQKCYNWGARTGSGPP